MEMIWAPWGLQPAIDTEAQRSEHRVGASDLRWSSL